jgi:hypothetical protein
MATRQAANLPPEARILLDGWLPRVREALQKSLRSVYLGGGLALGDFAPGWSDVDVCVVLEREIAPAEAGRIAAVHDEIYEQFLKRREGGWRSGQAVEGGYVPRRVCGAPEASARCLRVWGSVREVEVGEPISPFDRLVLSRHGLRLEGEEVAFAPPRRERLRDQLEEDLRALEDEEIRERASPIWLAGTLMAVARSIVFWRDGDLLGKTPALRREIGAGSPFADAFRAALACRVAGSATAASREQKLRFAFRGAAGPAAALLRSLALSQ